VLIGGISMQLFIPVVVMLLTLTSCGGGGNDSSNSGLLTPSGTTVTLMPLKKVVLGISAGSQYSIPALLGTDSQGRSWSGSMAIVADGAMILDNISVTKCRTIFTFQSAGSSLSSMVATSYYRASDGSAYKSFNSATVEYSTALNQVTLPDSVKVGDSGEFITELNSDGTVSTSRWSIKPDYNGGSILEFDSVSKAGSSITSTETDRYYLSAVGEPLRIETSSIDSGLTLNLTGSFL
jgi:hypothetical protein